MKKLAILFTLFAALTFISTNIWAGPYIHIHNNEHNKYGNGGGSGGAGGDGGAGGAGGAGGSATSSATASSESISDSSAESSLISTITSNPSASVIIDGDGNGGDTGGKNKLEDKRELSGAIGPGGPAEAQFRMDDHNIKEGDWRVFPFAEIIKRMTVWDYESANKLSANLDKRKMHKNLLRVMEQKTKMLEYVSTPPVPKDSNDLVIFLGWIPMSPDTKRGGLIAWLSDDGPNDLTVYNMVGNQVVAACEAGATHLIPVKEGHIRGGHSEVDFLGIAGGGSSVFEDGTKRAGGVSGSIGPSKTTMDAWDMDRPFVVVEAWCRVSDVKKTP